MQPLNLTNHLLIAMPGLSDPHFHRAVTLICAHSPEGAMGIVINHPLDIQLGEVLSQMDLSPHDPSLNLQIIYQGGPVQQDRGFVLHRPFGSWDSTLQIGKNYGVATSRDILQSLCQGTGPRDSLIALGYAGWEAGQLEQEIAENAWLFTPAQESILFDVPSEARWRSAAALLGISVDHLSMEAGHA